MRVSLGFTPKWYADRLGVDFSEVWHMDPEYRYSGMLRMREYLSETFPEVEYFKPCFREGMVSGSSFEPACATISTLFGIMLPASCYGLPVEYRRDNWPDATGGIHLPKEEIESIVARGVFDFSRPWTLPGGGKTLRALFTQMDFTEGRWGPIHGYLNYQGILNIALKLRGNDIFMDMFDDPDFVHAFFGHIAATIGGLSKIVQARQRASGFDIDLLSVSNCVMSMVSPAQYEEFVLPLDLGLSQNYSRFGVHTCNWVIDPYADSLRKIPKLDYIDTGMHSDLARVKRLFPEARRAVLYSPGEVESKSLDEIAIDLERVALEYAPCDIVLADVETTAENKKIRDFLRIAASLGKLAEEKAPE